MEARQAVRSLTQSQRTFLLGLSDEQAGDPARWVEVLQCETRTAKALARKGLIQFTCATSEAQMTLTGITVVALIPRPSLRFNSAELLEALRARRDRQRRLLIAELHRDGSIYERGVNFSGPEEREFSRLTWAIKALERRLGITG